MSDTSVKAPGPSGTAADTTRNMQANTPNGTGGATYFRKGFGLKSEIQSELDSDYTGHLVDLLKAQEYTLTAGDVTIRLAKEFGFCYGVERAVEYAYQARKKFPDRTIYLAGEIIHNPHVNSKLQAMGVEFLLPGGGERDAGWGMRDAIDASRGLTPARMESASRIPHPPSHLDFSTVKPEDVVVLPAFGVTIRDFEALREIGCVMVDTTCGSVLNVWKRVESYAKDGLTALIHGKAPHEETRATASQVRRFDGGHYLVVRDMEEARIVCEYISGLAVGEVPTHVTAAFNARLGSAGSPGFDPATHLRRIGVANQTTMLARESLAIAA